MFDYLRWPGLCLTDIQAFSFLFLFLRNLRCSRNPDMSTLDFVPTLFAFFFFFFQICTSNYLCLKVMRPTCTPSSLLCKTDGTRMLIHSTRSRPLVKLDPLTSSHTANCMQPQHRCCCGSSRPSRSSGTAFQAATRSRRNLPSIGLRSSLAHTTWPWPGWTAGAGSAAGRRPPRWIHASWAHKESKITSELLSQ